MATENLILRGDPCGIDLGLEVRHWRQTRQDKTWIGFKDTSSYECCHKSDYFSFPVHQVEAK